MIDQTSKKFTQKIIQRISTGSFFKEIAELCDIGSCILHVNSKAQLINAYAKATAAQREKLDALLAEDDVDVKAVTEIYDEIDVKSICEAKMSECLDKGLAALAKTELGDRAKQLEDLACVLMDRKV